MLVRVEGLDENSNLIHETVCVNSGTCQVTEKAFASYTISLESQTTADEGEMTLVVMNLPIGKDPE
jgi:hypothetical protein